jgi:hypothetical protein
MSNRETFSLHTSQPADLLSALTAEAWLDPALAAEVTEDKHGAIARFAREYGYAAPAPAQIEAFELPANPVGDLETVIGPMPITATSAIEEGCPSTAQSTCPSTTAPGCPSTAGGNCGPCSASFFPSDCSQGCSTFNCTIWDCWG